MHGLLNIHNISVTLACTSLTTYSLSPPPINPEVRRFAFFNPHQIAPCMFRSAHNRSSKEMSFPFQKGDTSPQSSSYYSSDISSPRGQSPIWKSSKRKGLQIDWSKVLQLVSVVAAIGVFFLLLRSIIPGGGRQEDFAALKNPDRKCVTKAASWERQ